MSRINFFPTLNYKFQTPDARDYKYTANVPPPLKTDPTSLKTGTTPTLVSLRNNMPPILNQGQLGSCVSNAVALYLKYLNKTLTASRLYIYFNGRAISNFILEQDTGLYVRDGCKSIARYGACQETVWPYTISQFATLPPLNAYKSTFALQNFTYLSVAQNLNSLQSAINQGYPIIFGFLVYYSFMTQTVANTGMVPMPNVNTEVLEGGHCCLIVGYDNSRSVFICANSWGTGWGDRGYFYIPYAYILNVSLASDFWIMKTTNSNIVKPTVNKNYQALLVLNNKLRK